MSESFVAYGPPGCGKTHYLGEQVQKAVAKYGGARVVACSYTRSAAAVIAGRVRLPRENVGTLHAMCYRALGRPNLTAGKEAEFGKDFPDLRLSSKADMEGPGDAGAGKERGDMRMAQLEILRAHQVAEESWPVSVQHFAAKWREWKERNGLMDFSDLLETCLHDVSEAPGSPAVGFLDEAQDCSRLQMAVAQQWAKSMNTMVYAGDDDQLLYRFAGATPDAFLDLPIDDAHKRILSQSYRVPRAVHALAESWVSRLGRRQKKDYRPRDADGEVRHLACPYKYPEGLLGEIEPYLAAGKTIMFLASCSYMIDPLKAVLRREGIPFHNPLRAKRGDWNPLATGGPKRTMPVDRVLAFLRMDRETWPVEESPEAAPVDPDEWAVPEGAAPAAPPPAWTWNDVRLWAGVLQAKGVLRRGAKEWLESLKGNSEAFSAWELGRWLEDGAREELGDLFFNSPSDVQQALAWWLRRCLPEKRRALEFPVRVAGLRGGSALRQRPQIILGSIHSAKGGEADVTVIFPDLSPSGMREWMGGGDERDAITRMFYVSITRARETLILCRAASQQSVSLGA